MRRRIEKLEDTASSLWVMTLLFVCVVVLCVVLIHDNTSLEAEIKTLKVERAISELDSTRSGVDGN